MTRHMYSYKAVDRDLKQYLKTKTILAKYSFVKVNFAKQKLITATGFALSIAD